MPPAATTGVLATGAVWSGGVGCDNPPEEFPEPELVRDDGAGPNGCDIEELVEPEVAGAEVIV